MNRQALHDQIIDHEGLRLKPYRCTEGELTIGVGHNLDSKGISEAAAYFIMKEDLDECEEDLHTIFPNQFKSFPEDIQIVLMDMRFQLGPSRFRGFKKMIQAVRDDNPREMIKQMRDSRWYRQTTKRAETLIRMVQVFVQ